MRPTRKTQVFSLSSISVGFLVIPLVVLLVIFLIQPTAFSSSSLSSSSSETTWNPVASNDSSNSGSNYSVPSSTEEIWQPQPSQAPVFTFSNNQRGAPAPAPQIFGVDDEVQETITQQVEGPNKTLFMSSSSSSQLEKLEASLGRARSSIREAAKVRNKTSTHQDPDYVPRGPIYRNPNAFHRSYLEMEKLFKIYVYEEGQVPIFHDGPCFHMYLTEGRFIHEMEKGKLYRTTDPNQALVYFLPFSVVRMVQFLYLPDTYDRNGLKLAIIDYINLISHKHPFWNRSLGADHFMLSCHDWGPFTTAFVPHLLHKSIRVLCNANTSEGFNPSKDASLPEIKLITSEIPRLGGQPPSKRSTLAFFAGGLHGHIRYLLLNEWKGKDQDVQVYEKVPQGVSYEKMMKSSKFCLCPSGYEVASPRVVEAIYAECVPVLISDGYIPPFSDVLDWKSFSVQVPVKNISDIKNILMSISNRQYLRMQRRVKQVQRHFLMNGPPKRYDVFHMIVHSVWLRRLNIHIQDLLT
ncbi:putative glycosyltransferase [Prunus yedoensis var. nudiflora]|uniref:Putative glycosyltransferase n=1 Tax=Prunus yedoensis var. nudiflora TaxID=2094558 RepID=A0A314ZKJ8_PRUYE|nr:putative glycosyltransferase [Prunus yedoensis var. nudiflora]